jgi:hypothetical protein
LGTSQDFKDDLRKAILKHAEREFGITDADKYLELARDTVAKSGYVFAQDYKGEPQYLFAAKDTAAYAVVDMNMRLRGLYGHRKPGEFEKCLKNNLQYKKSTIVS